MLANLLNHAPILAHFSKNHKDFIVKELNAYEFSGSGEWLIVQVRKKDLSTPELISDLASALGIKARDIGYAGLKDRAGMTEQYLSLPRKCEPLLGRFTHEKAKILSTTAHENKLKIGHLIGNWFMIRLKKVTPLNALKITQACEKINEFGFANYFGYQRFGRDQDNAQTAQALLRGEVKFSKKLNKFLISALQSELFNKYLHARVQLSRMAAGLNEREISALLRSSDLAQMLDIAGFSGFANAQEKLLQGLSHESPRAGFAGNFLIIDNEKCLHYPFGKVFCESLDELKRRFLARDAVSAGLILGAKADFGEGFCAHLARAIYSPFIEALSGQNGSWRHLISFASELKTRYDEQNAHFVLEFRLQKGCYATTLLEQILNKKLTD